MGGPQQLEAVAAGLGSGALMGQNRSFARRGQSQRTYHPHRVMPVAGVVGKIHPVAIQSGLAVPAQDSPGLPFGQAVRRRLVAVEAGCLIGKLDPDRVVRAVFLQRSPFIGRDDVIRRCDDVVEPNPVRVVAEAGERLESGHGHCVARCGRHGNPRLGATHRSAGSAGLADCPAMTWLLDLDGVVWLSGRAINGSPEAIERLRRSGERIVFFTNNSGPTVAEQLAFLAGAGVVTSAEELLTSSQAAASLLEAGTRAAFIGDAGIAEALTERGIEIVPATGNPDAVVVGRTTNLSYDALAEAATAIRDGARFIATNADATLPTPDGPMPGVGAIVAFLQAHRQETRRRRQTHLGRGRLGVGAAGQD